MRGPGVQIPPLPPNFMQLDRLYLKKRLDEWREHNKLHPRTETVEDWADEWWYGLCKKYGCDPVEVWDAEIDELERKQIL